MWEVLSCPFNKPLALSNRTRRENSSQIVSGGKNLLKYSVQGRIVLCFGLARMCVCVCVWVVVCVCALLPQSGFCWVQD